MTTPSSAASESFESRPAVPAPAQATRPLYWSVRREFYEYRSIYLAPMAIGGVVLLGFVWVLALLPHTLRTSMAMEPMAHRHALARPFDMALPSFMKHIHFLEDSGWIRTRKEGRVRTCVIEKTAFATADAWLSQQRALWEARFDRFDALLEETRDD